MDTAVAEDVGIWDDVGSEPGVHRWALLRVTVEVYFVLAA
jgi:hypothetical protein